MSGTVYILKSLKNSSYYVGSTSNLERRFTEHQNGLVVATKNLLPIEIVFSQNFEEIRLARQVEYGIKRKKSRVIIEKIINEGKIRFIE